MTFLKAFTKQEMKIAHRALAARVAQMMGRKFEEDDWADVYCEAKGIPETSWSNLNIDIMHKGLGVEHKMLKVKSDRDIMTYCGTSPMHPALTRSIRVPGPDVAPNKAMAEVFKQYHQLVEQRKRRFERRRK